MWGGFTALTVLAGLAVGAYLLVGRDWSSSPLAGPLDPAVAAAKQPAPPAPSAGTGQQPEPPPPAAVQGPDASPPAQGAGTAAAPPGPGGFSTKEIVARCERSVGRIQGVSGHGSGFLVKPDVLVTNAHVIRNEFLDGLRVHFPSANEADRGPIKVAALLYEDQDRDLAFLAVRCSLPPLKIADQHTFIREESPVPRALPTTPLA